MARILRGEIRWAGIEPHNQLVGHEQGNTRPALILSSDHFNYQTELVVVALITSSGQPQGRLYSIPVSSVQMPRPSWILTGQIRTLSTRRIGDLIGTVSNEELARVHRAILRVLGLF